MTGSESSSSDLSPDSVISSLAGFTKGSRPQLPSGSPRDPHQADGIARRFTPQPSLLLNSPQRPPMPFQCDYLISSLSAQDISHVNQS
jgi:hypothetical protein